MLRQRILSTIFWFLYLWFVIFVLPAWACTITVTVIIALGLKEFFDMAVKKGILIYRYFGIIIGCLLPIAIHLQFRPSEEIEFFLMAAVCFAVFLLQFTRRETEQALAGIATTVFGIFYISWLFSFMVKLRVFPPMGLDGRYLILYILLVTKTGDISAYLIGTAVGKHQLIPRISPKKSVEGTIAAVATSFLMAILFKGFLPSVQMKHIIALGFILSILGQIGDLSESLIKRDCRVKDSGAAFPGLGGILDTIDSLLFTVPVFYFYLKIIS